MSNQAFSFETAQMAGLAAKQQTSVGGASPAWPLHYLPSMARLPNAARVIFGPPRVFKWEGLCLMLEASDDGPTPIIGAYSWHTCRPNQGNIQISSKTVVSAIRRWLSSDMNLRNEVTKQSMPMTGAVKLWIASGTWRTEFASRIPPVRLISSSFVKCYLLTW